MRVLIQQGLRVFVAWGLWGTVALGQGAGEGTSSGPVRPTTTVAAGDKGGRIFGRAPNPARVRHYYVAAEMQLWDYTPAGADVICGKPLPPHVVNKRQGGKMRYVQYTDASFTSKVIETQRLGVMGPVLRGTVGDYLVVTFQNNTSRPLSMHPHGVKYDKDSEGSYYQPKPGLGAAVEPGAKFTYVWLLDEDSGPMPSEPSSKAWLYHSHVEGDEEVMLGLSGFIVVTDPRRARPDGTPNDVDREMAALFMIYDESDIGAAAKEALEYGKSGINLPKLNWAQIQEQTELGSRFAINGYVFGNAPGLEMMQGERVRWYLFALGSEKDFHTAHWHGMRVREEGRRRTDVVELLPASMKVADMVADNPGTWLFHCHVAEHMMEGMFARVVVHEKSSNSVSQITEPAFFGLEQARESMRFKRAEASVDGPSCELQLEGSVTVFHAFSIFTQPITIRLGQAAATFEFDRTGQTITPDGVFRIRNAGQFGVVYGGLLEFEATLRGTKWQEELRRLGWNETSPGARSLRLPLKFQVGNTSHQVEPTVTVFSKYRRNDLPKTGGPGKQDGAKP